MQHRSILVNFFAQTGIKSANETFRQTTRIKTPHKLNSCNLITTINNAPHFHRSMQNFLHDFTIRPGIISFARDLQLEALRNWRLLRKQVKNRSRIVFVISEKLWAIPKKNLYQVQVRQFVVLLIRDHLFLDKIVEGPSSALVLVCEKKIVRRGCAINNRNDLERLHSHCYYERLLISGTCPDGATSASFFFFQTHAIYSYRYFRLYERKLTVNSGVWVLLFQLFIRYSRRMTFQAKNYCVLAAMARGRTH